MRIRFTKMHGAGNDFVVLDETHRRLGLSPAQYRFLGDRHLGVGADQILSVRPAPTPDVDFAYVIHNSDGEEVEHCGNGARCFLQYVREHGLSAKDTVRVQTQNRILELHRDAQGRVTVDMGPPEFNPDEVPFDTQGLVAQVSGQWQAWPLELPGTSRIAPVYVLSMGNPHAVLIVDDVVEAPVTSLGPLIESHRRFPRRVNAGFLQIVNRTYVRLRVYERGAGETLACGTGACAAVVAGRRLGLLDARVDVATGGGRLTIEWEAPGHSVRLTGPAVTVFEGEIELPALP